MLPLWMMMSPGRVPAQASQGIWEAKGRAMAVKRRRKRKVLSQFLMQFGSAA